MYTLFSSGRFSCVFKDRLLILTGSLAILTGILALYNRAFSIFLPWVLSLMGVSILTLMVYDRTHNMKTLLNQGAVPHSERLMALLETHRDVEEKARVMLMGRRDRTSHPAFKLILQSLYYDTEKHVKILDAIMHEMEHGGPPPSELGDGLALREAREGIEDHIWIEQRLINALAIEVREANSPVVQMLLTQILEEEKGHHAVLQRIFNLDKDYAVNRVREPTP